MKQKHYNVRWDGTHANVSFNASHDSNAIKQADKLGRELGVSHTTRTIYEGSRLVQSGTGK